MSLAILDEAGLAILDEADLAILDENVFLPPSETITEWTIYVRDITGQRVAQLDTFSQATLIPRFNDVGTWTVTAPYSDAAVMATTDRYGLEFVRNDTTVMSGPVMKRTRVFDETTDGFEFEGRDDSIWLLARLASPQPSASGPPYLAAYDVRTGPATTVLAGYASANLGPSAVASRQVPGLTIGADPAAGSTVTGRGRWQPLLELFQELAAAGGVGFRIRRLTFEAYQPVDRSASVKFSTELGNLRSFTHSEQAPDVNHVVVGGGGELTDRVIREVTDPTSVAQWGRFEAFQDRRDTSVTGELDQAGQGTLTEGASKVGFALEPLETESVRYLVDYDLGDLVTVVIDGVPVVDVVREVVITLNEDGETVTPTVGDPTVADPRRPRIFDTVRRLAARVRNIERI